MSRLSLYDPPPAVEDDQPHIIPFATFAARLRGKRLLDAVSRARLERRNRQCPCCGRVTVEPVELADARRNRNGASIPGTATIVGFICNACRHRWPVLQRA